MATEPVITFLDLACAIGADPAHNRTIQGNLERLCRDALLGAFPPRSLGWNAHSNTKRLGTDEYPPKQLRRDGSLDLLSEFIPITRKEIVEMLAEHKLPEANRVLESLYAGHVEAACHLVAEGPLPEEGSHARLFIESLATTLSEARQFCERQGWPVPAALQPPCVTWNDGTGKITGGITLFAPKGYLSIPDAVWELHDALHPAEERQAAAELMKHRDGDLPASYTRFCEHRDETEKLLLKRLADRELVALVKVDGGDWAVPAEYWGTDGARMVTMTRGNLDIRNSSSADWRFHGQPCFIEEVAFRRVLYWERRPATPTETPSAVGANALDRPYWTYMMVLAWVYFGERALVEQVADSAVNRRTFRQQVRLPDGRTEMVETDAGPITPLWLTLHANRRREKPETATMAPKMTCADAQSAIMEKLRADALTAYGLENDAGDLRPIPSLWWADGKVYEGRDGRPYAGPEDVFRSGATRWYGLLFKRDQVLKLWPEMTATASAALDKLTSNRTAAPYSEAKLRVWYEERVTTWPQDAPGPSRDEDWAAAKLALGDGVPRGAVRSLRRELAPADWKRLGRRKTGGEKTGDE